MIDWYYSFLMVFNTFYILKPWGWHNFSYLSIRYDGTDCQLHLLCFFCPLLCSGGGWGSEEHESTIFCSFICLCNCPPSSPKSAILGPNSAFPDIISALSGLNSSISVRWSAVPVAFKLVNVRCRGERGSGLYGSDDLSWARIRA